MATTAALPVAGSTMPDIALTGADGLADRLTDVVAGSRSVVFFMRASSCAVCIAHAVNLAKMVKEGVLDGVKVVVITPGGVKDAAVVAARVPSDAVKIYASGTEHAAAGLGTFLMIQHSGTFVLAADGTVLSVRTATIPTGSFSRDEVIAALR